MKMGVFKRISRSSAKGSPARTGELAARGRLDSREAFANFSLNKKETVEMDLRSKENGRSCRVHRLVWGARSPKPWREGVIVAISSRDPDKAQSDRARNRRGGAIPCDMSSLARRSG